MNNLIKRSFLNVLGTVAYISFLTLIMSHASKVLGEKDNALSPILFLTLFVLSAAITGSLVLGKPILMYANGQKSEAVKLFLYTLGWLAVTIIILVFVTLSVYK